MSGERDLHRLLRHLAPTLHPQVFVFCTFPDGVLPTSLQPVSTFQEAEGLSAIVEAGQARAAGVSGVFEARQITLTIHSSLEAIGLLAAVARRLAASGISCNAVAAYHHDHLFVPVERVEEAMTLLHALSREASAAIPD
jgi:hypothetical protein